MLLGNVNVKDASPSFSFIAQWLGAENPENFFTIFPILYILVCILTIIVFNLGFARKLPLLKQVVIYLVLLVGNILLAFFAVTMPIVESLLIAAVVLIIYKLRLRSHNKAKVSVDN